MIIDLWFLFMNFVTQTYAVVPVCVVKAMHTGCTCGLATGTISVGLTMYSVHVA